MWFFRSPDIVYGEEALSFLNSVNFKRILVITDRNIVKAGLLGNLKSQLPEGAATHAIDCIPEEPTLADIKRNVDEVRDFAPDLIIGLGGGSCMDAAKATFALYERPDLDVHDITPLVSLGLRKKSRLYLVPTTSGTGSECTWAAVLSDDDHRRKNELASPEIIADCAILDPILVRNLPKSITRNTAVDAITHAVEGHSSRWKNPYSEIFAEKAVRLISENLPAVLKNNDLHAREQVHIGASMAGLSFSNSQIGLAHAMGHSLGAHFRVPHGMSVGLYLPHVVGFSEENAIESYETLRNLFPEKYREKTLGGTLRNFFIEVGQPVDLAGTEIDRDKYIQNLESLVSLAEESTGMITNPRDADSTQILELFKAVT
jgi:alcohol dehydrogenase class IV